MYGSSPAARPAAVLTAAAQAGQQSSSANPVWHTGADLKNLLICIIN
jgi:hypothetical protein